MPEGSALVALAALLLAACGDTPPLPIQPPAAPEGEAAPPEAPADVAPQGATEEPPGSGPEGGSGGGAEPLPGAPPVEPAAGGTPSSGGAAGSSGEASEVPAPSGGAGGGVGEGAAPVAPDGAAPLEPNLPGIPGEPELPVEEPPAPGAEPPVSEPGDEPVSEPGDEEAEPEPDAPAPEAPPDEQTGPDEDAPGGGPPAPGGSGSGSGPVGPGSPDIPSDLPEFHITVIGSSTANGIGASVGDFAWVNLLDGALSNTVAARYSTTNLAVGGYTAADLLPGSGASGSVDEAIKDKPDLIVVALAGSNDITPGFTTAMFLAQLGAVRDAANAAGIPAFFMSPLPKSLSAGEREILGEWSGLMAAQFAQCWIPGTTQPYAPCYIDVFDSLADPELGLAAPFDSGDGQHPNDAGHALLFGAVDAIVQPYVCSKTDCR